MTRGLTRLQSSVFLFSLLTLAVFAGETSEKPVPLFTGKQLPDPPEQHAVWNIPATTLSSNLVSLVTRLFEFGLADPRGCEYREYEAVVGSVWGTANMIKTHGWVLPHGGDARQLFAVSWAGTVYPAVKVGEKADLKSDIERLIEMDEPFRNLARSNANFGRLILSWEGDFISATNMSGIKVAFLLRLGEVKLAEQYWAAWRAPDMANQQSEDAKDPFRELAYEWLWATYDRAICAHLRADDALALEDCRRLDAAWPRLENEADRRGFTRPRGFGTDQQNLKIPYFSFLEPLPKLLMDEQRRVSAGPHRTVSQIGPEKFPDRSVRIQALIADLEEFKGGYIPNQDPIIQALVAEGDNAVSPLLDCLEKDQRLTRSVGFFRSYRSDRNLVPVRKAAEVALHEILKVGFRNLTDYRPYWQRYHGLALEERWYETLRDDQAGREQWLNAAVNIMGRSDGKITFDWTTDPKPKEIYDYKLAGESLRLRKNPSVSDLLIKRALIIGPTNYLGSEECWRFQDAADLGLILAEWDKQDAVKALPQIIRRCPAVYYRGREEWGSGCAVVVERFAELVMAMAEGGDHSGLDLYATWVGDRTVKEIEGALPRALAPLAHFPNHPSIKKASARLFRPENGDWLFLHHDLLDTRLVLNESFRGLILQGLKNKSTAGDIVLKEDGNSEYHNQRENSSGSRTLTPDAFAPKPGVVVSYRVCDDVAHRLKRIEGLPKVELYWPEAKRNKAVVQVLTFLEQHGNDLKLLPALSSASEFD